MSRYTIGLLSLLLCLVGCSNGLEQEARRLDLRSNKIDGDCYICMFDKARDYVCMNTRMITYIEDRKDLGCIVGLLDESKGYFDVESLHLIQFIQSECPD